MLPTYLVMVASADRLGGVFDHRQTVGARNLV